MEIKVNSILFSKQNTMAEILTKNSNNKKVFSKSKIMPARVDLTPMVDLGFLLITFFIFTTTMANPTVMKLVMPDNSRINMPTTVSSQRILTLLVGKNNRLFYYEGNFDGHHVREIVFKALRDIIMEKKQQLLNKTGSSKMVVLIKVTNEAVYKDIVDSLDEMVINQVSTYMLVDPEVKELEAIKWMN